jgi:hypothetical protein
MSSVQRLAEKICIFLQLVIRETKTSTHRRGSIVVSFRRELGNAAAWTWCLSRDRSPLLALLGLGSGEDHLELF